MTIVNFTEDGLVLGGTRQTHFFVETRRALLKAGFKPTVWCDRCVSGIHPSASSFMQQAWYWVNIKSDHMKVGGHGADGKPVKTFRTKKIEKVLNLLGDVNVDAIKPANH